MKNHYKDKSAEDEILKSRILLIHKLNVLVASVKVTNQQLIPNDFCRDYNYNNSLPRFSELEVGTVNCGPSCGTVMEKKQKNGC